MHYAHDAVRVSPFHIIPTLLAITSYLYSISSLVDMTVLLQKLKCKLKLKCLTFLINDNFFLFITMNSNNNHLKLNGQKPNPNICLQSLKGNHTSCAK